MNQEESTPEPDVNEVLAKIITDACHDTDYVFDAGEMVLRALDAAGYRIVRSTPSDNDASLLVSAIERLCRAYATEYGYGDMPRDAMVRWCLDSDEDAPYLAAYDRVSRAVGDNV